MEARSICIRLLGPIDATVGGTSVDLRGARQRRLLAKLALRPGTLIDGSELIDAVWPEGDLPADPRETLRTYASRVRASLGGESPLDGRSGGYSLELPAAAVDGHHFEALLTQSARVQGSVERLAVLEEALLLWRGPAFAGFEHEDWARPTAARWTELRDTAADDRAELLIELLRHEQAVALLEAASHDSPLRERTHRLLMTALQLCGRQGEALRVYERFRKRLATDLGLDPGEEIRELEARIADGGQGREGAPLGGHLRGYRILERIGEGAFSVVYRGEQPTVGRSVAIKVIRSELANRADFVRRFEAEAHLVARLEHPHIVPLYDYWREPGSAYLVMRLLSGTLEDRVREHRLDLPEAVVMLGQVGSALAVAHRAGVVHRDVKPANIFGDGEGNWFLADFGIAHQTETPYRLGDLASVGSPAYAPPEQLRREPTGPSADVYGLAVVLFESLTGTLPFPDVRTQAELLRRRLNEPLPSVHSLRTEVPSALDAVLARATAKDPADRYLTIDEMVIACRTAIEGKTSSAPPITGRATLVTGVTRNPYKGLRAFQEADAGDFFGRLRLVDRLTERLRQPGPLGRLLTVVGPSGSGKSSVVRAGLLPAIRQDAVAGSSQWFVTSMIPGTHPFEELEAALGRLATGAIGPLAELMASEPRGITRAVRQVLPTDDDDLLLVVDQFEELFTLCSDDSVRRSFIDGLVTAVSDPRSRLRVVLTLRADFYDRPLRYSGLAPMVESGTIAVSPLSADELERAIVEPADRSGASFEPGLVARIIADFVDQPGALPLLQYAMTELFEDNVIGVLTIEAYEKLGGITGVLGRRAEGLYGDLSASEQEVAQRVMTRLVSLGEGTEDTRRRVRRSELGDEAATAAFIEAFGDARLLSFDHDQVTREPTVEVAHEALIREWPRLRGWLDEDRDGLRVHRHLTEVASEWVIGGRDEGELLRGGRLEATEAWADAHPVALNDVERELLHASTMLRKAEQGAEQERVRNRERQNRRLRRSLAAVGLVAVIAVLASGLAVQQRERANTKAKAARSAAFTADTGRIRSEAAQLATSNPRIALLLAAEAYRRDPGPESLGAVQQALLGSGDLLGYFNGGVSYGAIEWIDAHRFAAARTGAVDVFRDDGTIERSIPVEGAILLDASTDGKRLAIAQQKRVVVVDLVNRPAKPHELQANALIQVLRFSPDSARLAIGTGDGVLAIMETSGWREIARLVAHPERTAADLKLEGAIAEAIPHVALSAVRGVSAVAFRPGRDVVVTGGFGYVRTWNIGSGAMLTERSLVRETAGRSIAVIPRAMDTSEHDGRWEIVTADQAKVWRIGADDGAIIATSNLPTVSSSAGNLDSEKHVFASGRYVAVERQYSTVEVLNVDDPDALFSASPHVQGSIKVAVDPTLGRLAISSIDGISLLSTTGDSLISTSYPIGPGDLFISTDGRTLGRNDLSKGTAELWHLDSETAAQVKVPGLRPRILQATSDPKRFALLDEVIGAAMVDAETGRIVINFSDWPVENWLIAFDMSNDRSTVAWAGIDGRIQVRAAADGALLHEFGEFKRAAFQDIPRSLDFDVSGRRLMATSNGGHAVVWDLATGDATVITQAGTDFLQATFSPDGKHVAALSADGTVSMRDARTLQPTGVQFVGATASANFDNGPYFTPDSHWMATATDGLVRLWDATTGLQIGRPFPSDPEYAPSPSVNLRWLITGRKGRAVRWNLDIDRWPDIACRAAGRNFTQAEWEQYGPRSDYRPTCPRYGNATSPQGEKP